jgi:glutamine synthetase
MATTDKTVSTYSAVPVRTFERPRNTAGQLARVTEYYGSNVFDLKAMAKRLAAQDVETLSRVMKFGGKIDASLAERIASAVKEWAMEKGATHYCHWFQPQTGATAEKHDAFLWFDKSGNPIERFTGAELLQSEPDASSFPSGGLRATFEARGYTGWDPSSPMFIMETENGRTVYIPSVFISYHGEALDFKTPLLRSNEALSREATKTLHILGEKDVVAVTTTVGPEQEFFLIDSEKARARPDLRLSGRTVLGRKPPKGQELEDHYFGHIPSRVQAFFNELEVEAYKLGIPVKTRHNEVAPGQFEIAPIFEGSNIASDHNQLAMKVIKSTAAKHGFLALLHEKPFAGVNGSGKHVNWSMSDSTGRNLLDPGHTPHENIVFLTFLCATLQGIHDNADVLRASIATSGNDHRLGANEAPPAIISAFLGNTLDKILTAIETGETKNTSAERALIDMGVSQLQHVAKDNTDRNRTSPFAFTGNKFEFRAVGSSAPVNYPTAILNAAVTDGLVKLNAKLEAKAKGGVVSPEATLEVLKDIVIATKNIRFEGNGYSQEWRDEAARRGLSNFHNTPMALRVFADEKKTKFLRDTKTLSGGDLESRLAIQLERYIKQRLIEVTCAMEMVQSSILPATMRYLGELVSLAKDAAALNIQSPAQKMATEVGTQSNRVQAALAALVSCYEKTTSGDSLEHENVGKTATAIAEALLPKLDDMREAVDELEVLVPSGKWPFPKYQDMLFGLE